ncbi:MAG: hypothetical protein ACETWQ_20225 [Phycisphaerae bacterium]
MKKKIVKGTLGIIGLIVLGAIGSGLWDIGIKPIFIWFLEAIFKITTLGISSLSDSFYRSVASELHEDTSSFLQTLIIFLFVMFFIILLDKLMYIYFQIQDLTKKYIKKRVTIFNERTDLVVMIILVSLICIQFFNHSYRNRLLGDFRQKFTIAKVVLNEKEEEIILAKFSTMKNKKDYVNLMDTLQEKIDNEVQPQLQQNDDKISSQ